jgi:hypothetical protein
MALLVWRFRKENLFSYFLLSAAMAGAVAETDGRIDVRVC